MITHDKCAAFEARILELEKENKKLCEKLGHCMNAHVQLVEGAGRVNIRLIELEKELSEAKKLIAALVEMGKFYALTSSWNCYGAIVSEDHEFIEKWYETIGGKRARACLKENEELIKRFCE